MPHRRRSKLGDKLDSMRGSSPSRTSSTKPRSRNVFDQVLTKKASPEAVKAVSRTPAMKVLSGSKPKHSTPMPKPAKKGVAEKTSSKPAHRTVHPFLSKTADSRAARIDKKRRTAKLGMRQPGGGGRF